MPQLLVDPLAAICGICNIHLVGIFTPGFDGFVGQSWCLVPVRPLQTGCRRRVDNLLTVPRDDDGLYFR